jgi:hypothetical protein
MSDDARLELGEDGLPVDSGSVDLVAGDLPLRTSRTGGVLNAAQTVRDAPTAVRRIVAAGIVVALIAAVAISTRSTVPLPSAADVLGVSARVVPQSDTSAAPRILASYAVSARRGSAAVRIVGLTGDGVAGAVETASPAGTQSFLVEPACDRILGLAGSAYALVLSPVGDPASTTNVADFDGSDALDTASVRACWVSVASRSLRAVSVSARPGPGPWTALDVVLRNSGNLPLSVTAIDVANVDTLSMADSQVVAPRTSTGLRVRMPIATCSAYATPTPVALTWSVGPPGDAPNAFARTTLTERQRTIIATAARARCGAPPATTVTVLRSTAARDDASIDPRGLSVSLRVRITTDAVGSIVLGDDTSGLTSDARPVFTGTTVHPGPAPAEAVLVWHTRCGATTDDSSVPVATTADGLDYSWSVPLTGTSLPTLRSAACR